MKKGLEAALQTERTYEFLWKEMDPEELPQAAQITWDPSWGRSSAAVNAMPKWQHLTAHLNAIAQRNLKALTFPSPPILWNSAGRLSNTIRWKDAKITYRTSLMAKFMLQKMFMEAQLIDKHDVKERNAFYIFCDCIAHQIQNLAINSARVQDFIVRMLYARHCEDLGFGYPNQTERQIGILVQSLCHSHNTLDPVKIMKFHLPKTPEERMTRLRCWLRGIKDNNCGCSFHAAQPV